MIFVPVEWVFKCVRYLGGSSASLHTKPVTQQYGLFAYSESLRIPLKQRLPMQ